MAVVEDYSGNTTSVLIQAESTYGTDPGTWSNGKSLGMLSPEITHTERNNLNRVFANGARAAQAIVANKYAVTGTMTGFFQIGRLLAYALGADTKGGAGPYTHTFAKNAGPLPSFAMLVSRGASANKTVQTYTGCYINQLRFTAGLDQPLEVSADFTAQLDSVNTSGNQAGIFDSDVLQVPQFGSLSIPTSTAIARVQSFEATLQNTVPDVYQLGNRLRQGMGSATVPATNLVLDLRATVIFNDSDMVQLFKDMYNDTSAPYSPGSGTDTADQTMKFVFSNLGATTALRDITFNAVGLRWEELAMRTRVGELTMMELTGQIRDFTASPIVTTDNNNVTYPA